jgi:hypothetical protein
MIGSGLSALEDHLRIFKRLSAMLVAANSRVFGNGWRARNRAMNVITLR